MEDFNAEQARQIVDSKLKDELHDILVDIKNEAEQGRASLRIYKHISDETKKSLVDKGFRVVEQSSISIQIDKLYYSIYW